MRTLLLTLAPAFLFACAEDPDNVVHTSFTDGGYVVEGDVPASVDLQEVLADLPPGGFAVVGDPTTGEIATVTSTSNPLARTATAEFSVSSPAVCTDCGDPTCASFQRTVEIGLSHDTGINGETYSLLPFGSNFTNPVTTPSTWPLNVGSTITLSTVGTLTTCSAFSFYFEVKGPNRAFVTSTIQSGLVVGGATNANTICQTRANAAGLGGTWMAWLGDPANAVPKPQDRFTAPANTTWVRTGDGAKIADNLADLTDGTLDIKISKTETGANIANNRSVWTGMTSAGNVATETCNNWTSGSAGVTGRRGNSAYATGLWTDQTTAPCNSGRGLYCFEQ